MSESRGRMDALYGSVALVGMLLVIWERLDPDGPQELWQRLSGGLSSAWAEYRGYREAMQRTLDSIHELPELDRDEADRGRAP